MAIRFLFIGKNEENKEGFGDQFRRIIPCSSVLKYRTVLRLMGNFENVPGVNTGGGLFYFKTGHDNFVNAQEL